MAKTVIFVGGARDYHVMDWYRTAREVCPDYDFYLATDLIESEGLCNIVKSDDKIIKLLIIDKLLFRKQTALGNIWRNILKLFLLPFQALLLRIILKKFNNPTIHAIPMYYMLLCWIAKKEFIGTPQGSEILVRAKRSWIYRYFAIKCLSSAKYVTVDSVSMQKEIKQMCGKDAVIIQNGIDVNEIIQNKKEQKRIHVVSVRGFSPLYRIETIVNARNNSISKPDIYFIYPFSDANYKEKVGKTFKPTDKDLGRLSKKEMYDLLYSAKLVISIPLSDASPRSVYEAIFCGACVAVSPAEWIGILPLCMKERIYIVDLANPNWFDDAIAFSDLITKKDYIPSEEAKKMFDQKKTIKSCAECLY